MKKHLLNESEVRKFMKFANLGALAENFVNTTNLEEEGMDYGYDDGLEEQGAPPPEEGPPEPPDVGPEEPPEEFPEEPPEEEGGEEGAIVWDLSPEEAQLLQVPLEDLAGQVAELAGGGEPEEGSELPFPPEEPGVPEEPVEEPTDLAGDDEELDEANIYLSESTREKQARIINEVTSRVARRLLKTVKKR